MNRAETEKIVRAIYASYPGFYKGTDRADVVTLWHMMFDDVPLGVVGAFVKDYLKTEHFPPTPSDIYDRMKLSMGDEDDATDAWNRLKKGISNSLYCSSEEFEQLDDITKRIVGAPKQLRSYAAMDSELLDTVVHAQFVKSYNEKKKADKMKAGLPSAVLESIRLMQSSQKQIGGAQDS